MNGKILVWFLVSVFGLLLAPLLPVVLGKRTAVSVVVFTVMAAAMASLLVLTVRNRRHVRAVKANPELAPSRGQSMLGMAALALIFVFFGVAGLVQSDRDMLAVSAAGLGLIGLLSLGVLRATRSS